MCANCAEIPGCGTDILARADLMSEELLTFKNQKLLGVQPDVTPAFKTICVFFSNL